MPAPIASRRAGPRVWDRYGRPRVSLGIRAAILLLAASSPHWLRAQTPPELARERSEFARWLADAPLSPYAMIALQPIGPGISIGPEPADIPIPGTPRTLAREARGLVTLEQDGRTTTLPSGRPVTVGGLQFLAAGPAGRTVLAVYGRTRLARDPIYFPFASGLTFQVRLEPPERRGRFRVLGLDGIETEAVEAGFVAVPMGGQVTRLRVYRLGDPEDEEAGLQVFFRDATNGRGTYPAGRFVELLPAPDGRYLIDFNRARNPFCAYSPAYPCPPPWPGNTLPAAVEAGERYRGAAGATGP
jgi:hypothetical protein